LSHDLHANMSIVLKGKLYIHRSMTMRLRFFPKI